MKIKLMKPRNPHAVAARQRNAGAHGEYQAERRQRRMEKQTLRSLVIGQDKEGKHHA
jgi:hypothetical protein